METAQSNGALGMPGNPHVNGSPNNNKNGGLNSNKNELNNNYIFNGINGFHSPSSTNNMPGVYYGCANGSFGKQGTANTIGNNRKLLIDGGLSSLADNVVNIKNAGRPTPNSSVVKGKFFRPNDTFKSISASASVDTSGNNVLFGASKKNMVSSNGGIVSIGLNPFQANHNKAAFGFKGSNSNLGSISGSNSFHGNVNRCDNAFNHFDNGYNTYSSGFNGHDNYGWHGTFGNNPGQNYFGAKGNYMGTNSSNGFGSSSFMSGLDGSCGTRNIAGPSGVGGNIGFNWLRSFRVL